jgi:hypothetical protein
VNSEDKPVSPPTLPPCLRTDAPPETGEQILAWAIDEHAYGYGEPAEHPRWVIAQFASTYPRGPRFWQWSVPGRSTSVRILGWLPLSVNDYAGSMLLWGGELARVCEVSGT